MAFGNDITGESVDELFEVLESENDIVRIVDPLTREIMVWPAVDRGELDVQQFECNAVWGRTDRCINCSSFEALKMKQRKFKMELNNNRAFWVQSCPITLEGRPCVLEVVNDVTDGLLVENDGDDNPTMADLIEGLNKLVVTDALTLLFNRRFLDDFNLRLSSLSNAGTRVNIAMIDFDDMKVVNDTYGHPAGDAVLRDVAGFLKLNYSVRDDQRECYAVRYGGDEFLVIDIGSDFADFEADVRTRYSQMRRVCYFGEIEIPFSLSCGFASSDEFGWDWNALLNAADKRMYADKLGE